MAAEGSDDPGEGADYARTTVLLGAGASRDAGLPLTEHLARQLVESFDRQLDGLDVRARSEQEQIVRALHVVYGAMVAHATEQGSSPLSAVNVERLVSAVRLLRDRRTHEAAPFIASWRGSVEDVDAHPVPIRDSDLHIGFDHDLRLNTDGLAKDIANIAKSMAAPGTGETFRLLEDQLLRRIAALLANPTSVEYLHPLVRLAKVQPGGLDITTLNYDRTIELAAAACDIPVDTGLDRWQPGTPLEFEMADGRINLIKPHGSVDWIRESGDRSVSLPGHPLVQHRYRAGVAPSPAGSRFAADTPLIVIGDREKLETDGPTLPLMRAFESALLRASKLIVIGYSFGDDHINTVVRNWLAASANRMMTILDPGWPQPKQMSIGPTTRLSLREALEFMAGISLSVTPGRIVVVRSGAREGLQKALDARPLGMTQRLVSTIVCLDELPYIRITNHGYDLDQLTLRAWRMVNAPRAQSVRALRLDPIGKGEESVVIGGLEHGDSVKVYFDRVLEGDGSASVYLTGESWAHLIRESFSFQIDAS